MNRHRLLGAVTFGAALCLSLTPSWHATLGTAACAQDTALRPAVGNPLAKAKSLMAAHSYGPAMAQVEVADRQKGKTPYENFVIQEMRGAIAQASGDNATASTVYQGLIASGQLHGVQLQNMLLAEISLAYQNKDYPGAIGWADKYQKAGGKDPSARTTIIQAYYLQHDYANAAKAQKAEIDDQVKARKTPTEGQLQLLAACQKQIGDNASLATTMEQLVTYYPKPGYWADLIYALQVKPGLSDRLEVDLDRFKLRVGGAMTETDYIQMAQLALGDNDPGQAAAVIADATDTKVFGTGAQAAREARLTALVQKTSADTRAKLDQSLKDLRGSPATTSEQLYDLGRQYVSYKMYDQGLPLMQEAVAKGDLRRQSLSQLRLAEALVDKGDKPGAIAAFKAVTATDDGTSDLARLWVLWLKTQPAVPASVH